MLNKVPSKDFSGGLSRSKMGREIKKIPSSLLNYSEKRKIFETLRNSRSGGLDRNEARGILRNLADNKDDSFSRRETQRLTKHLEKATGYRDLNWHGSNAKKYGEKLLSNDNK